VREWLALQFSGLEREVFGVIYLDAQHRLIDFEALFTGTLTQTSVYPREVVKAALARNAAAVMFVHNHLSGCAEPNQADQVLTETLKRALAMVDTRFSTTLSSAVLSCLRFASADLSSSIEGAGRPLPLSLVDAPAPDNAFRRSGWNRSGLRVAYQNSEFRRRSAVATVGVVHVPSLPRHREISMALLKSNPPRSSLRYASRLPARGMNESSAIGSFAVRLSSPISSSARWST
jgi:RadC-like JAB domain